MTVAAAVQPAAAADSATITWSQTGGCLTVTPAAGGRTATITANKAPDAGQTATLTVTAQGSNTITKRILVTIKTPTVTGLSANGKALTKNADGVYEMEMLYTTTGEQQAQKITVDIGGVSAKSASNVKLTVDGGKAQTGESLIKDRDKNLKTTGNTVQFTLDSNEIKKAAANKAKKTEDVVATFTIGVGGSTDDKTKLEVTVKLKQGDKSDSGIFSQTPAKKK